MYCPKCGRQCGAGESFCSGCGAPLNNRPRPSSTPPANQAPQKHTALIVVCVIVLVVAVGVMLFSALGGSNKASAPSTQTTQTSGQQATQQQENQHQTYPVVMSFVIPDYDEATATPIPILVKGTNFEGKSVSRYFAARPSRSFDLERGSYSIQIAGSPINGNGYLYTYNEAPMSVDVNDQSASTGTSLEFGFEPIPPENVTDEQLEKARNALKQIDISENDISKAYDRAVDLRQQRINQIEAERAEDERKANEAAEAARRANPESVDATAGPVTLKGTLVREDWPTSKTQMAWSAVAYFLEFDAPVTLTYDMLGETMTRPVTRVQVASVEKSGDANLSAVSKPELDRYVGSFVTVEGNLIHTGNAHTLAAATFMNPQVVEVL